MNALEILPIELWKLIYNLLPGSNKYNFSLVCKNFFYILADDNKIILHLNSNLNTKQLNIYGSYFNSLVIHDEELTGKQLKFFSNVQDLDLSNCNTLEPEDIKLASLQCTSLSLYGEAYFGLNSELNQIKKLKLIDSLGNEKVLEYLTNIEDLTLIGCDNFTGESVIKLPKLKKLELIACSRFTQNNLDKLVYLTTIKVYNCSEIFRLPNKVNGKFQKVPQLNFGTNNFIYHASLSDEVIPFIGI
jgi:hypothetical protein